jgi:hypothetical protein
MELASRAINNDIQDFLIEFLNKTNDKMVKAHAEQQRKLQEKISLQNIFFDMDTDAQIITEIKKSDFIIN